jgi:hypothetical protein
MGVDAGAVLGPGLAGAAVGRAVFAFAASDFAASAAASAAAKSWKCFRTSSAWSRSSELEWVFFSVTPICGR